MNFKEGIIMKAKLLQLWNFVKVSALWIFTIFRRCCKVVVEETIKALQLLDSFLG
jgi:NADH:ubiquinone oxidoreductase subunit B-like Fe-S oxidoreductase